MEDHGRRPHVAHSPLYKEAGVRNLERELARLARKAVREIETGAKSSLEITPDNLPEYAGVPKFRHGEIDGEDRVGVVTGLAWTSVGATSSPSKR